MHVGEERTMTAFSIFSECLNSVLSKTLLLFCLLRFDEIISLESTKVRRKAGNLKQQSKGRHH